MKYIKGEADRLPILELTRRNLLTLLAKLEDPTSQRTMIDQDREITVRAVSDDAHYTTRTPGEVARRHVDKFEDEEWVEARTREAREL